MPELIGMCKECQHVKDGRYKNTYAATNHGHGCEKLCNDPDSHFINTGHLLALTSSPASMYLAHHPVFVHQAAS